MIIGNVLPPIGGLKLHTFYNGGLFLTCAFCAFVLQPKWRKLFVFLSVFLVINFVVAIRTDVLVLIDTLSGVFVFIYILALISTTKINYQVASQAIFIYILCSAIPLFIALLQYFGIFPLTVLDFDYINVTKINGEEVQRLNGLLWHPSDLAALNFLLYMLVAIVAPPSRNSIIFVFLIFFVLQFLIYIKSAIAGIVLLFLYFNIRWIRDYRIKYFVVLSSILFLIFLFSSFYEQLIAVVNEVVLSDKKNQIFNPNFLTNRGRMWSTFVFSIGEKYEGVHYLFGGGFGVYEDLFIYGDSKLKMWFRNDYIPTPHNQFLSSFISGGITLIVFYVSLFVWANKTIKYNGRTVYSFLVLFLILVFTSGITMPFFDKFITWVSFAFICLAIYLKNIQLSVHQ